MLTPKPALVDQRGPRCAPGPRSRVTAALGASAARQLSGHGVRGRAGAWPICALRETLGALGRRRSAHARRDRRQQRASRCDLGAGAARGGARAARRGRVGAIAARAARLARLPDRLRRPRASNGARACRRFGVPGARGEAAAGFPHVTRIGLPALHRTRRRGRDESCARLDALLAIMASLEDTCLLHRGGRAALWPPSAARARVLALGGRPRPPAAGAARARCRALRRCASPGGCADLLAACLFLDELRAVTGPTGGRPWKH